MHFQHLQDLKFQKRFSWRQPQTPLTKWVRVLWVHIPPIKKSCVWAWYSLLPECGWGDFFLWETECIFSSHQGCLYSPLNTAKRKFFVIELRPRILSSEICKKKMFISIMINCINCVNVSSFSLPLPQCHCGDARNIFKSIYEKDIY